MSELESPPAEKTLLVLGLNPALQHTLEFRKGWERARVNRSETLHESVGGKGQQVSRACCRLCESIGYGRVLLLQLLGGSRGRVIEGLQEKESHLCLSTEWLPKGETRECTTLVDDTDGSSTELISPSPEVTSSEGKSVVQRLESVLESSGASLLGAVLSGTVPSGISEIYEECAMRLERRGIPLILDTVHRLSSLLERNRVLLLKINMEEFHHLLYADSPLDRSTLVILQAVSHFRSLYPSVSHLGLTDGPFPSYLMTPTSLWCYTLPTVPVRNAIGCGDVVTAVTSLSHLLGEQMEEAFQQGLSASLSALQRMEGGDWSVEESERLYYGLIARKKLTDF